MGDFRPMLDSIPGLILGGAFFGIMITSFGVLLQALYLAGDMDFLLSAPVPIRAVFISKLLQAILPNFGLICIFALPVLFGLGISYQYHFLYYPLVIIVLVALALAAAGLTSLLVLIIVRIIPARRVAEVLGFFGAIISILCSQSGQFARFNDFDPNQATEALEMVSRFNTPWSPLNWAGQSLVAIGQSEWLSGVGYLVITIGLCALIFVIALTSAERLYYTGWANMQGKSRKKKARRKSKRSRSIGRLPIISTLTGQIPLAVRTILTKDSLVLRRDLRNMSQLVTPLILGIVYTIMFVRNGPIPEPDSSEVPAWAIDIFRNLSLYMNVGISLFVGWMLLARVAGIAFSQEGKNYWLLKSAPVNVPSLIAAKYLAAYIPALLLGWLFLLVISVMQRSSITTLPFTMSVVALCVAGNAGLNLAFGITGARLDWEDPRQMQKGPSGCFSAIATIIYLPVSLLLFFTPEVLLLTFQLPAVIGQVMGLILGGVFSLVCAALPLWLVRKRVPLLAEN